MMGRLMMGGLPVSVASLTVRRPIPFIIIWLGFCEYAQNDSSQYNYLEAEKNCH